MKLSFNLQRQQGKEFYSKQSDNLNANNLFTLKHGLLVTISLYFFVCFYYLLISLRRGRLWGFSLPHCLLLFLCF